jgi:RPA family protein
MSEAEDSDPGRREVAHRLFAAEFDDSEFSYSESDEERAPNYVVTPTGARVNRLFVVGVLTELEQVNDEVLRARVVDPTGPFVVYAGQYQPDALAFLEAAEPPLFVAVTGKASTFEPEDSDRVFTSIRPESISEVDAETRDRWVVQAAEQTIGRVGRTASAKASGLSGDELKRALVTAGVDESDAAGTALALDYYGTTGEYLQAVRDLAYDCARVVAGERDEAGTLSLSPDDGTDTPLSALATRDIDAPDTETEVAEADSQTAADEAPSETVETTSTAESESTEASTATEPAETSATAETDVADDGSSEESESPPPTTATSTDETPSAADSESTADEPETTSESVTESSTADSSATTTTDSADTSETLGDFESGSETETATAESDDEDIGEFDTEFELDEDEREEIEQEYGTDFQSGSEVDDAGEADIDTPAEPAEDVDLEDAVMAAMKELDDGGGADREAVLSSVVDQYGADREAVEDAIQDALMGGRCYEPDDGKLTPI